MSGRPRTGGSTVVGGVGTLAVVVVLAAWAVGATALAILGLGLVLAALLANAWTRAVAAQPLGRATPVAPLRPWRASPSRSRSCSTADRGWRPGSSCAIRIGPLGEQRVALARNGSGRVVVERAPRGRYALGPGSCSSTTRSG